MRARVPACLHACVRACARAFCSHWRDCARCARDVRTLFASKSGPPKITTMAVHQHDAPPSPNFKTGCGRGD
eukprot:5837857-Alexandrium_andersonii.AAC.1